MQGQYLLAIAGTLIATDVTALPASVQVITSALLEDMGTRRVEDSIRFVSGVGLSARNEKPEPGAMRSKARAGDARSAWADQAANHPASARRPRQNQTPR
ncbi:MAG: hypothetical protein ACREIA_10225, partial [Opitutaceae bacterium]